MKGKPLSSLKAMDCAEYLDHFLHDPQLAGWWIGRDRVETQIGEHVVARFDCVLL
nr:hypothetical protein [Burkholderia sp. Ac-20384]